MKKNCILGRCAVVAVVVTGLAMSGCKDDEPATPAKPAAAAPAEAPAPAPPANDWCAGHGVPESKCTKCNPELIEQFKASGDWCDEHGFPESVCPVCNPQPPPGRASAQPADWCAEHGLPESKCTTCNPELIEQFKAAGDWCDEHGFPESVCPSCNPMPVPEGASAIAPGTRIRFRSPDIEEAAGIDVVAAREAAIDLGVEATARIEYNRDQLADVRAAVPGVVREVLVGLGQEVEAGTRLFVLASPRVGDLQGQLRAARQRARVAAANFERQRALREDQIASARQVELARQEQEAAEAELRALEAGLRIAGAAQGQSGRYTVRAPIAGTVVRRPATVGTFATEETSLATVADTSVMWALLDVRELDAAAVRIGQPVAIRVNGVPDRVFNGEVTWIASEVDPRTRTVAVRAEIPNSEHLLRANQFARGTIQVAAPEGAVAVPREAVQRLGEEMVAFVRTGEGVYEPRVVELGRSGGELVQVMGSVRVGDPVVTEGAFLLKTELSKDSIGAGCCEVEPPGGE